MSFAGGAYAIWVREVKVFFREKERLISAIVTPLLWIIAFGAGLGASVSFDGTNYQTFVYPGIVAMSVLFGSIFYGIYIIWDRKLDFLKEVLVAPVPRSAVFVGKMLGGMTDVVIQVIALLVIGLIIGMPITLSSAIATLFFAMVLSMCLVSLGLIIGANMKSPDGFNLVLSFVMWPMFMFSGALFPMSNLPGYLDAVIKINPMTYGVDLIRFSILGTTQFGVLADLAVLVVTSAIFIVLGSMSFERLQNQ